MAKLTTIKIIDKKLKSGFRIINESDFDSKAHKKFIDKKTVIKKGMETNETS